MVTFVIDAALALEPERVVVVVGHGRELVEAYLRARYGDRVTFALQPSPRGTADAVRAALPSIAATSREVIITYGDCPLVSGEFLRKLAETRASSNALIALATTELDDPTGYGRILRDADGHIRAIREHKDCTPQELEIRVINAGLYAVDREFLERALSSIDASNAQGEFYLTDLVALAHRRSPDRTAVVELRGRPEFLRGINDRAELAEAEAYLIEAINDRWRRAGNSIAKGARIERDVVLAHNVTIEQGVVIRGKTVIESNVTIDVGCVLDDAIVRERALLKPYSIVSKSEIGPGAQIGPFAHIRPESVVGQDAHVGNFVELKKTRMDKGAKANHLAYLGDGVVGEAANIGAGTIFCNYDGFSKHTTTIGAHAFVGSNSALVAPVTIGEGAYVGSGSVVTQDVPKDALAIARARQENKLGWAAKYRALKKTTEKK